VGQVPPVVEVCEEQDFSRFHVVVAVPSHAWVDPDYLQEVAARWEDPEWRERLAGMFAFAHSNDWTDERGRLRAHVEVERERRFTAPR
jgi:hypothetical protein